MGRFELLAVLEGARAWTGFGDGVRSSFKHAGVRREWQQGKGERADSVLAQFLGVIQRGMDRIELWLKEFVAAVESSLVTLVAISPFKFTWWGVWRNVGTRCRGPSCCLRGFQSPDFRVVSCFSRCAFVLLVTSSRSPNPHLFCAIICPGLTVGWCPCKSRTDNSLAPLIASLLGRCPRCWVLCLVATQYGLNQVFHQALSAALYPITPLYDTKVT